MFSKLLQTAWLQNITETIPANHCAQAASIDGPIHFWFCSFKGSFPVVLQSPQHHPCQSLFINPRESGGQLSLQFSHHQPSSSPSQHHWGDQSFEPARGSLQPFILIHYCLVCSSISPLFISITTGRLVSILPGAWTIAMSSLHTSKSNITLVGSTYKPFWPSRPPSSRD